MQMKYIVIEAGGKELIFVFPDCIVHAMMFEHICAIRSGFPQDRSWHRPYLGAKIVSAGFIHNGICGGKSESLKVKARPNADAKLFADGGIS